MKKYRKFVLITLIILTSFFVIKSRRVDKFAFNFFVNEECIEILKSCIALSEYEMGRIKDKPEVYYLDFHVRELCNDKEKMIKIIEQDMKKRYREEWLFVY